MKDWSSIFEWCTLTHVCITLRTACFNLHYLTKAWHLQLSPFHPIYHKNSDRRRQAVACWRTGLKLGAGCFRMLLNQTLCQYLDVFPALLSVSRNIRLSRRKRRQAVPNMKVPDWLCGTTSQYAVIFVCQCRKNFKAAVTNNDFSGRESFTFQVTLQLILRMWSSEIWSQLHRRHHL
jgi:hypothetical protein